MKTQVQELLVSKLPKGFNIIVDERKSCFGGKYLKIAFSPNTHLINGVSGQYPQLVSLSLDLDDMELQTQVFGCNGGGRIYREVDKDHPRERFLAMVGVKVPFRKPKKETKFVLKAIERFVENYMKVLKENAEVLRYKSVVDYSFLN
jgi:hypothetical protein|tara:strand:- start:255 stop:695 length:441 start_codon:yes stop_codon:yes gene_type:complete